MVICDTGIISDYLSNAEKYQNIIDTINDKINIENVVITPVIRIELNRWLSIQSKLSLTERRGYNVFFNKLERDSLHINKSISKKALEISNQDNSLDAADILIGATAIVNNISVYTNNIKHFERMVKFGLKLFKD